MTPSWPACAPPEALPQQVGQLGQPRVRSRPAPIQATLPGWTPCAARTPARPNAPPPPPPQATAWARSGRRAIVGELTCISSPPSRCSSPPPEHDQGEGESQAVQLGGTHAAKDVPSDCLAPPPPFFRQPDQRLSRLCPVLNPRWSTRVVPVWHMTSLLTQQANKTSRGQTTIPLLPGPAATNEHQRQVPLDYVMANDTTNFLRVPPGGWVGPPFQRKQTLAITSK